AGDRFQSDQAGGAAPRQWWLSDSRGAQSAAAALRLGGIEARPALPRDSSRSTRTNAEPGQYRIIGAGAHPVGCEGGPPGRATPVLHALRVRPRVQGAV